MRRQGNSISEHRAQLQQQVREAAAADERNRLARDLHDSIKQQLFSIRMSALAAQAQIETNVARAQEALADIQQSATEAQVEMQALLQQLRSSALEHTSFAEAIQTQAQALEYRSGARVQVEIAELPLDRCPLPMQEVVFRIVQEAFANIARHARAQQVTCTIGLDDEILHVVIHDDGQGFDPERTRKGMGLTNIQERARGLDGTARIASAPDQGTSIRVQIPLFLPNDLKQEQEQKAKEQAAHARAGLQLRSTMAVFTMLVLLIDVDLGLFTAGVAESRREFVLLILLFCLLMMFYGVVSAHLIVARMKASRGKEDRETSALRLQVYQGWTASLRLALFSSWHLVLWIWRLSLGAAGWEITGGFLLGAGLILVLILFAQSRLKHARDNYYRLLSSKALQLAINRPWRGLRVRLVIIICIAIAFSVHGSLLFFAPVLLWQWLAYSFFFAFFIQCLCLIIDAWQLRAWRKLALAAALK